MNIIKVLFIRANLGHPDSRVEKEIYSLGKCHDVELLGWDRRENYGENCYSQVYINGKPFTFHYIGIFAPTAMGFKKMLLPMIRYQRLLIKWLLQHRDEYDVIHACDLDTAICSRIIAKICKKKFVYDVFDYYCDNHHLPYMIKKIIRKIDTSILNSSDYVLICSEARKQQISPARPKKICVIHNSPPQLPDRQIDPFLIQKSDKDRIKIVYMGSLVKERFLEEVIDVIGHRIDCELHIGGMGPIQELIQKKVTQYTNTYWYGEVEYLKVLQIESNCNLMIALYSPELNNHKYAAPNKFYEALMLKKPLIMMRDTGMDSYIEEYGLGEVIDSGAVNFKEGFSRALDNLIAKKNQWSEMGERGYKLYEEQFSWDEMENRLLDCYRLLSDAEL